MYSTCMLSLIKKSTKTSKIFLNFLEFFRCIYIPVEEEEEETIGNVEQE